MEVALARIEEIHQPSNLNALCSGVVWQNVIGSNFWFSLPLPKSMHEIQYIFHQLYALKKSGNTAFDPVLVWIQRDFQDYSRIMWELV